MLGDRITLIDGRRGVLARRVTIAALAVLGVLGAAVVYAMLELLSGGRAYVHAEGRWSKAQQTAVFQLDRYAETGSPRYLRRAREALRVPLGDRQARLALSKGAYDYRRAYDGFLAGENRPADIPTMIWLFEHFENAPYFRRAIETWTEADRHVVRLASLGDRLESEWSSTDTDEAVIAGLRRELTTLDRQLRPLENKFSSVLGEGLLWLKSVFGAISALVFLSLVVSILSIFHWAVRHISESERKFWATVEHAPVGVALVGDDGALTHVNDTLCGTLGYERGDLLRRSLGDVVVATEPDCGPDLLQSAARAGEPGITVEAKCLTQPGDRLWCKLNIAPFPDGHGAAGAHEYIVVMEDISEARQLSERLSYQAAHDPLTGLLNRRQFEDDLQEALDHARTRGLKHVLGFVDLDRFKHVNDVAGHYAGDRLLEAVAEAMRAQLRANDSIARVGGDEFGFILHGCGIDRGLAMAERLRAAVEALQFHWEDRCFETGISIGLVELSGDDADPAAFIRAADQACYRAKRGVEEGICVFTPEPAA